MSEGRPYSPLGEVIMDIAAKKNIRRAKSIENYMRKKMGRAPSNVAISKWLYGDSRPDPKNGYLELFADAFEATPEERVRLAYADTFRCPIAA